MGFAAEIKAEMKPSGSKCSVASTLASLSGDDRTDMLEALLDVQGTSGTAISRALVKRGLRVSGTTLQRHRRGDCGCGVR